MLRLLRSRFAHFCSHKLKQKDSAPLLNFSLLKWTGLILGANGLGFAFYMVSQEDINASFSRMASKATGKIATCTLPMLLRKPLLSAYCNFYGVIKDDMLEPDLQKYNTFQDFFTRKVKPRQFSTEP